MASSSSAPRSFPPLCAAALLAHRLALARAECSGVCGQASSSAFGIDGLEMQTDQPSLLQLRQPKPTLGDNSGNNNKDHKGCMPYSTPCSALCKDLGYNGFSYLDCSCSCKKNYEKNLKELSVDFCKNGIFCREKKTNGNGKSNGSGGYSSASSGSRSSGSSSGRSSGKSSGKKSGKKSGGTSWRSIVSSRGGDTGITKASGEGGDDGKFDPFAPLQPAGDGSDNNLGPLSPNEGGMDPFKPFKPAEDGGEDGSMDPLNPFKPDADGNSPFDPEGLPDNLPDILPDPPF